MVFLSYLHFWQQPANPRNLLCTCNDFFWVESHQTSWSLSDLKNLLGEPKAFQSFYLENSSHFNSLNHQANLKYPFPCTFLWPTQNISRTLLLKPTTIWGVSQKTRVVGSWKYFSPVLMAPDSTSILKYLRKISHGVSAQAIGSVPTRQLRHRYLKDRCLPQL